MSGYPGIAIGNGIKGCAMGCGAIPPHGAAIIGAAIIPGIIYMGGYIAGAVGICDGGAVII
jgi:hypothetical protein